VTPEGFLAGVGSGNTNRTDEEEIVYEEKEKSVDSIGNNCMRDFINLVVFNLPETI
jgi:hypothetical protein